MIDTDAELRLWFLSIDPLVELVGRRCYALQLPAGYNPVAAAARPLLTGPAFIYSSRGGPQAYSGKLLRLSYQFECYGADQAAGRQVAEALHDGINLKTFGPYIRMVNLENAPVFMREPDTGPVPGQGWPFWLSFYTVTFANP